MNSIFSKYVTVLHIEKHPVNCTGCQKSVVIIKISEYLEILE